MGATAYLNERQLAQGAVALGAALGRNRGCACSRHHHVHPAPAVHLVRLHPQSWQRHQLLRRRICAHVCLLAVVVLGVKGPFRSQC